VLCFKLAAVRAYCMWGRLKVRHRPLQMRHKENCRE